VVCGGWRKSEVNKMGMITIRRHEDVLEKR